MIKYRKEQILSKTQSEVYDLDIAGSTPKEIAQILGKDKSGIYKIIKRYKKIIQKAEDEVEIIALKRLEKHNREIVMIGNEELSDLEKFMFIWGFESGWKYSAMEEGD